MPCDYSKYPKNWKEIRARILEREAHKCKFCSAENYSWVQREHKPVRIILTIAHLNHDINDNRDENLAALCQRCHIRHDVKQHAWNAAQTRNRKRGLSDLFEGEGQP